MEEMYSPKSAASNFLHELCESRQKNLGPFMQQVCRSRHVFGAIYKRSRPQMLSCARYL